MRNEYRTIRLNGALCMEIEEFLRRHPQHGTTVEDFVVGAGRIRAEQLAPVAQARQPARPHATDEDYSHDALGAAWNSLNKTGASTTAEEKTQIVKGLAQECRKLRGGIQ